MTNTSESVVKKQMKFGGGGDFGRKCLRAHLLDRMRRPGAPESLLLEDAIARHVAAVFKLKAHNQRQTALALGVSLNTLKKRLGR